MKCPTCNQEIHDEQGQANGHYGAAMGLRPGEDLFGNTPTGVGREVGRNAKNRRSHISADWQPTEAQRTYCEQQGKDPDAFSKVFKDYYEAKGTPWLNWGKVWEKACREWRGHVAAHDVSGKANKDGHKERELSQWRARLTSPRWNPFWGPPVGEPGCMVPKELLP